MDELSQQPTTPQIPIPEQKNHYNWLRTLAIGFGIVSIGITIALGGYFLATKTSQPQVQKIITQPSPTPDPTANWKTYTDTKLKFSIKYPSDVAISRTLPEGGVEFSLASELEKDFRKRSIRLDIYYRGDKNITPEETQQSECPKPCADVFAEKTTINNASGVKVASTNSERYYLASTNSNVVGIFLVFPDTTSKSFQTDLEKFRQILSTFKFSD